MNIFKIFCAITALSTFSSCGQHEGPYTLTIITGLQKQENFKNLMEGIAQPHLRVTLATPTNSCLQTNLLVGMKTGPNDTDIATFPVQMLTPVMTSGGLATASDFAAWITQNSGFPPIQLKAPAGLVEFGVLGNIADPGNQPVSAACPLFNSTTPLATYSMLGHSMVNLSADTIVPLKVWVAKVNTAPSPGPAAICNQNSSPGSNDSTISQACPSRNFKAFTCSGGSGCVIANNFRIEYAIGSNPGSPRSVQWVPATAGSIYYVPDITPMSVTLVQGSPKVDLATYTFTKADFNNSSSATVALSGGYGTLSLVDKSGILGTMGALTAQQTSCTTGSGSVSIMWNSVDGATSYNVWTGTSSTGTTAGKTKIGSGVTSLSYFIPTMTSTSATYIVVEATNGINTVASPELPFWPIGITGTPPNIAASGTATYLNITAMGPAFQGFSLSAPVTSISIDFSASTSAGGPFNYVNTLTGTAGGLVGPLTTSIQYYMQIKPTNNLGGTCTWTAGTLSPAVP